MYVRYAMDSSAYTMYGILLMILSFTMYSFDFGHLRKDEYSNITDKSRKTVLISVIVFVILGVASCVSYFFHITPVSYDKKPSDLYTEVDRHPENYYVLDPVTAKEYISYTDNYIHPLWGFSSDFLHNVDGFGYLHRTNQLVNRNLSTNIYEAVVDGRNVYVIDKKLLLSKKIILTNITAKGFRHCLQG